MLLEMKHIPTLHESDVYHTKCVCKWNHYDLKIVKMKYIDKCFLSIIRVPVKSEKFENNVFVTGLCF